MKTQKRTELFRNFKMELESDVENGSLFDTTVTIIPNGETTNVLFTIEGEQIEDFIKDFDALISKYKI